MKKQVLSVADFGMMIGLVNEALFKFEMKEAPIVFDPSDIDEIQRQQAEIDKRYEERLKTPQYKSLKHLKEALESLNVEIETPDTKIGG